MKPVQEDFFAKVSGLGAAPDLMIANAMRTVAVVHSRFGSYTGEFHASPYAMLGLCTRGGGRMKMAGDDIRVDGVWRPGTVGLSLAERVAAGVSPPMHMLGIAFDLDDAAARIDSEVRADDLASVASALHDDRLLSAVATALWRDAEVHGSSSLFFEHGLALIVRRFCELRGKPRASAVARKLNPRQLADVLAAINSRLSEDMGVAELARVAGQDVRSFTRSFKRTTGYTPFAYLTARRMDQAKALLRTGASMIEIAVAVGYANPSKCAAAFRRWIGCSPTEWLRSQ